MLLPLYAVDDGRETTLWGAASAAEAVQSAADRHERRGDRDRADEIVEAATATLLGAGRRRGLVAVITGALAPAEEP